MKAEKAADVIDTFASWNSIHLTPIRSRSTTCVKLVKDGGSWQIALSARCNVANSLCSGKTSGSSSSPVWLAYSSCRAVLERTHAGSENSGLLERMRTRRDFMTSAKSSGSDEISLEDRSRNTREAHLPIPGGRVCSWLWESANDDSDRKKPKKSAGTDCRTLLLKSRL